MIKIISKKEYKDLWSIIDKQNEQIEELIGMVREAQDRATHATKCYCDLVELVDANLQSLPQEAINLVHKIKKTYDQGRGLTSPFPFVRDIYILLYERRCKSI